MSVTHNAKIIFLKKQKLFSAARFEELISSPHSISSETRQRWRDQSNADAKMYDEIIDFLASQTTNCFECDNELHGPYCPQCAGET